MRPYDRFMGQESQGTLGAGASVISVSDALAVVRRFAEVTTQRDGETFAEGFTDDCVVSYALLPAMRGRSAVREFFVPRLARLPDSFRCEKTLRTLNGNVLGVEYHNSWIDPESGAPAYGRGAEFWVMEGLQIARWDAAYVTSLPVQRHKGTAGPLKIG